MKLIFFDFEVFEDWWCVTFLDEQGNATVIQDRLELMDYTLKNKDKCIFIGFNNKHFDNTVWKCIWYDINPYKVVKWLIIDGHESCYGGENQMPELRYKKNIGIHTFDTKSVAGGDQCPSLKAIEANLGMSIVMSETLDNKTHGLTEQEKQEIIKYNRNDCIATGVFFNLIRGELDSAMILIDYYGLTLDSLSNTRAQWLEKVFKDKIKPFINPQYFTYKAPSFIPDSEIRTHFEKEYRKGESLTYTSKLRNINFKFGLGGIHGDEDDSFSMIIPEGYVLVSDDFTSYYPNMMANKENPELRYIDNVLPWNCFCGMIDVRTEQKHKGEQGDKKAEVIGKALKIPVNGASGNFRCSTSKLYDWTAGVSMCLTGQLGLYSICKELQDNIPGIRIFNVNTDGLYAIIKKEDLEKHNAIIKKWQDLFKIEIETGIIEHGIIAQKDVNNYIIYDIDKKKTKKKGSMVNLSDEWRRYDMAIVAEAICEKFINGTPIQETVMKAFSNNEARKFQFVCKASLKFDGLWACNFKDYKADAFPIKATKQQRVCRVFAVSDPGAPMVIRRKGLTYFREEKDHPIHQYIYNGNLSDFDIRKIGLDIQWYINKAQERYKAFGGK